MRIRTFETVEALRSYLGLVRKGVVRESDLESGAGEGDLDQRRRDAEVVSMLAANTEWGCLELGVFGWNRLASLPLNLPRGSKHNRVGRRGMPASEGLLAVDSAAWEATGLVGRVGLGVIHRGGSAAEVCRESHLLLDCLKDGGFLCWTGFGFGGGTASGFDEDVVGGVEAFWADAAPMGEVLQVAGSGVGIWRKQAHGGERLKLGLVCDREFHEEDRWVVATTGPLVKGILDRFDVVWIGNQDDYEAALGGLDVVLSMEPGWAAPRLDFGRNAALRQEFRRKASFICYSDPHANGWREDYFLSQGFDRLLAFYDMPTRRHFRRIPEGRLVHFPWVVPDEWIPRGEIQFHEDERLLVFGGSQSPAYTVRNWCRGFSFVESSDHSGCENKVLKGAEVLEWLSGRDVVVAAGSDSPEYRLTTPKYFETAAAGALLFAQETEDLGKLGFEDGRNCVVFNRGNFERLAQDYLQRPQDFLSIRLAGRELIRNRHSLSHRLDGLERRMRQILQQRLPRRSYNIGAGGAGFSEVRSNGFVFHVNRDRYLDRELLAGRYWEPGSVKTLERWVRPGMTVLDVGANIGSYSLLFSRWVGPEGTVLAFEPTEEYGNRLESHLRLNGADNVLFVPTGLSDRAGAVDISVGECSATMHWVEQSPPRLRERVKMDTLDSWWTRWVDAGGEDGLDAVKVDLDGHEPRFLRGAMETLRRHKPVLLLEFSRKQYEDAGFGCAEVIRWLREDLGYALSNADSGQTSGGVDALTEDVNSLEHSVNILCLPDIAGWVETVGGLGCIDTRFQSSPAIVCEPGFNADEARSMWRHARRVLQAGGDEVVALQALVIAGLALEEWQDVARGAVRMLEGRPGSRDVMMVLALCLFRLGDYESCKSALEQVLADTPMDEVAMANLRSLHQSGDSGNAATDTMVGLLERAKAAVDSGDVDQALACIRQILEHDPSNADHWMVRGNLEVAAGDSLSAAQSYSRALELVPDLAEARERLDGLKSGRATCEADIQGDGEREGAESLVAPAFCDRHEVYLASADRMERVLLNVEQLRGSAAECEVFATVIGGLSGMNYLTVLNPQKVVFFDLNPGALDYCRLVCELVQLSEGPQEFISRIFGRSVEEFCSVTDGGLLNEQNQDEYLSRPVEASLVESTLGALSSGCRHTYREWLMPHQAGRVLEGTLNCRRLLPCWPVNEVVPVGAGEPTGTDARGERVPNTNVFFYGHGWLGSREAFGRVRQRLASVDIEFRVLNLLETSIHDLAQAGEGLVLHVSNIDDWFPARWEECIRVWGLEALRQQSPLLLVTSHNGLRRMKADPHAWAWYGLEPWIQGSVVEVTRETPWGFHEMRRTNVSVDEYLQEPLKADTTVLHILLGEGEPRDRWEACVRAAAQVSRRFIIMEHNRGSADWRGQAGESWMDADGLPETVAGMCSASHRVVETIELRGERDGARNVMVVLDGVEVLEGDELHSGGGGLLPRILMIVDVPNWIFARHARYLQKELASEFEIDVVCATEDYDEAEYDLVYPLEWNLVEPGRVQNPAKYVTGIRSHCSWDKLPFDAVCDRINGSFQAVHVVSERLQQIFEARLRRVLVMSHGIDTGFFSRRALLAGEAGKLRIGWAGNRNSAGKKGFFDLLQPLSALPGVTLVHCGYDGQNRSQAEMREFYESIDCYVCASESEGNNNSVMEAAAMQLAIVTTDNGTVPEYLVDGESALIVDRTRDGFARAVLRLRDDVELRQRLGVRAREAVESAFAWSGQLPRHAEFFRSAIARAAMPALEALYEVPREGADTVASKLVFLRCHLSSNPQDNEARLALLATCLDAALWVEAAQCAVRYLEQDPANVQVLMALGHSMEQAGEAEAAREVWQQVLQLDPENIDAMERVGQAVASAEAPAMAAEPCNDRISFCLITDGRRPLKLRRAIDSICALNIPDYEVLVGGNVPAGFDDVIRVDLKDAAQGGRLGELRNALAARSSGDRLVVSDDDMIFQPDFYSGLQAFGDDFEVQCCRLLNPDGTRFWDWATQGGERGHSLLGYDEVDPFVYPTGGLCILKRDVLQQAQWDDQRGFYQGEDVDFAARLRRAGISIRFNRHSTVVHDDVRYTQLGAGVVRLDGMMLSMRAEYAAGRAVEGRQWLLRAVPCAAESPEVLRELLVFALADRDMETCSGVLASVDRLSAESTAECSIEVGRLRGVVGQGQGRLPVRWMAPIFNPSGYASEALNFILPLSGRVDLAIHHHNQIFSESFVRGLPELERGLLVSLLRKYDRVQSGIVVSHNPAPGFAMPEDAVYRIGRTMYETDRIDARWVEACNRMDEVWVPSEFNVETFARSGVDRTKLRVMPGAVDETVFDPAVREPLELPGRARCNFLSVFEWSSRKGWDVLLEAYVREFGPEDDVCLHLRTYLFSTPDGDPVEEIQRRIESFLASVGLADKPRPRIQLIRDQVPAKHLPSLYLAADALVAPSRGEGWGRPQHESMLMGVPVIGTGWSGNTEFMTADNSYLIDYELVEARGLEPELRHYEGHRWANPSAKHLQRLLRHVYVHPEEARSRGKAAREDMLKGFSRERVADLVERRLREIESAVVQGDISVLRDAPLAVGVDEAGAAPIRVRWEGSFEDNGSLSQVNRAMSHALRQRMDIECETGKAGGVQPSVKVTVRHAWPPDWSRPVRGKLAVIQPWEFGMLPRQWVDAAKQVDEFWVPSNVVKACYVSSGIPEGKVHVVPNGVDTRLFHPGAAQFPLATSKRFKFLFVGGTIQRKGPDLLLEAYLKRFTAEDDVCLVIKDFGAGGVYQGKTFSEAIEALRAKPGVPEILYMPEELTSQEMAGLYTACDCLVHAYRGEGFGLPVLEAMACGLPVIVTAGGAADDFTPEDLVYKVAAEKRFIGREVDGIALCGEGWLLEPSVKVLGERMKEVYASPAAAFERGRKAAEYVRAEWKWSDAAVVAAERIGQLAASKSLGLDSDDQLEGARLPLAARVGSLAEARGQLSQGKVSSAWASACELLQRRPYHPEAWLMLGGMAQDAGAVSVAKKCAKEAVSLAPGLKAAKKFTRSISGREKKAPEWMRVPEVSVADKPRLSVCLITRNEEKFLAQCLESVKGLAWQLIVVDTGSTDRTLEIAQEHGAEVSTFEWCDDFAAARNAALERARGDWVLVLDADEELSDDGRRTILDELRSARAMAYRLPIVNHGDEAAGRAFVPRLFRNAPGIHFTGRIHEHCFTSVDALCHAWGLENRMGKSLLVHYGYDPEVVAERGKAERNLRLLRMAVEDTPGDPNLRMNLGLELCQAGQGVDGLREYREAIRLTEALPANSVMPEFRECLLSRAAMAFASEGEYAEALSLRNSPLLKQGRLNPTVHYAFGLALSRLGRHGKAVEELRLCVERRGQPSLFPALKIVNTAAPDLTLALALAQAEEFAEAEKVLRSLLSRDAGNRKAALQLANVLWKQGQAVPALELLHGLVTQQADLVDAWALGGRIALSQPDYLDFAMDWTGESVKYCQQSAELNLQRAEALLLKGDVASALPVWSSIAEEGNPSHRAAQIICELATGAQPDHHLNGQTPIVSQHFLLWYRRLVQYQATGPLNQVNGRLDVLKQVLPPAGEVLESAMAEAVS